MEFFDFINDIIDVPNTQKAFKILVDIASKNTNKKYINYKDDNEIKLNKRGLYILINLINYKSFYDKIPDTDQGKELKYNGFVVIKNIKVIKHKIVNINEICKNIFNINDASVSLKEHKLVGPHSDSQNQIHMDRAHPTIKWFLYTNNVSAKNGAFCYSKGSHVPTKEKLQFLYKISCMTHKNKEINQHLDKHALGAIRVAKNNKIMETKMIEQMKFEPCNPLEYDSYTLIIADTSGFHKRGVINKGEKRTVLLNQIGFPKNV